MEYIASKLGAKLYGLLLFSQSGLFSKKFVILKNKKSKKRILSKLKTAGFEDNDPVAIRFSIGSLKKSALNLPTRLGKFSLNKIAEIIFEEVKNRSNLIPYVHDLISAKETCHLYYDGKTILIEVWPGRGAFKKSVFNISPDIIKIDDKIKIFRYLKTRKIEDANYRLHLVEPHQYQYLLNVAKKINSLRKKFNILRKTFNPFFCDFFIEKNFNFEFSAIQKTKKFDTQLDLEDQDYFIAKRFNDLENYRGQKKLFFDIPLSRNNEDWPKIFNLIKHFPVVYTRSLTMHLATIFREFGIEVRKGIIENDYEIKEYSF